MAFAEVSSQIRLLIDSILSEITGKDVHAEENSQFKKHLSATKSWFARISCANKKRFIIALLKDVRSSWTLAQILKSIWNCRLKDAVMSVSESRVWSSYDQAPMDHDRTALPLSILIEVMMSDHKWFQTLERERQTVVLSELLSMAGGPVMWEALKRAQKIYDRHEELQQNDLLTCEVVQETSPPNKSASVAEMTSIKKDATLKKKATEAELLKPTTESPALQAQKELETNLAIWASTVKTLKDQMKLEELEMTYKSGTTKIWKVHRAKLEIVETVDLIQLLPSALSKRILIYLTTNQLVDCARVNRYWAHLVDEVRTEIQVRQKIDIELEKLRDNIIKHDEGLDLWKKSELETANTLGTSSTPGLAKERYTLIAKKSCSLSLCTVMNKQAKIPHIRTKPIRNMKELNERLETRGAADENVWRWCRNVLKISKQCNTTQIPVEKGGKLAITTNTFPCPKVSKTLKIPLENPLTMDPQKAPTKPKETVTSDDASICMLDRFTKQPENNRYCPLCLKDFTKLYPVCKCLCHMAT